MKTISFGDVVDPLEITRFKGKKDVPGIVSIISEDIKVAFMHYEEGIGYFYCFSEICCERLGLPSVKYIIPIIEYTLKDAQEFEYSSPIFVKYMSLTQERYQDLLKKDKILRRQNRNIFDVDLIVTCSDEVYQKITIDIFDASLWKKEESLVREVKRFINVFNKIIEFSVGRKMDSSTYQTLISNLDSTFRPEPQIGQSANKSIGQGIDQSVIGETLKTDIKSITASDVSSTDVSSTNSFIKADQATIQEVSEQKDNFKKVKSLSDKKITEFNNDLKSNDKIIKEPIEESIEESIERTIEEPIVDLNELLESSDDLE